MLILFFICQLKLKFLKLVQFLRDQNPQVRTIALSNLVSYTAQGNPYRNIFFAGLQGPGAPNENDVIKSLKALCRDDLVCFPFHRWSDCRLTPDRR